MVSAVIVAGGQGKRMGAGFNKLFLKLCGREIISHTLEVFEKCNKIDEIILVTSAEDKERMMNIIASEKFGKVREVVEGGKERSDSVYNGLKAAEGAVAVIHDGARCLVTAEEIERVIADAEKHGAAALGVRVKDTLKRIDGDGRIIATVDRESTVQIQTPQVFALGEIQSLHERVAAEKRIVTDDCSIFELYGKSVYVTLGSYENIKITTPEDIAVGEKIMEQRRNML